MRRVHLRDRQIVVVDRQQAEEEQPAAARRLPRLEVGDGRALEAGRRGHPQPRRQLAVDALEPADRLPERLRRDRQLGRDGDLTQVHSRHSPPVATGGQPAEATMPGSSPETADAMAWRSRCLSATRPESQ